MTATIFDATPCALGEGPLWHPQAQCLFWFDINAKRLYRRGDGDTRTWQFDEHVSAAGWVDATRLLIASETALRLFDSATGESKIICPLESDTAATRSNDGRADPQGGFWIGTMGKRAQSGAGAIYRYHDGALRKLYDKITIPNAISFHPDGQSACFTDTPTRKVMRVALDAAGWPLGRPEVFLDLADAPGGPDGAVFDAKGIFWLALWGAGCIIGHDPAGQVVARYTAPAPHLSCPAFGGPDLSTLFATSATEGRHAPAATEGATFHWPTPFRGQAEHRVIF
ncbi:MAG: SMP-30/gluconolactonase/LRE family protein [Proteobacteria bacterium]|nr:SMP-30/gluconolactonase/LRE family protein [Pseudomonadota bacterium]